MQKVPWGGVVVQKKALRLPHGDAMPVTQQQLIIAVCSFSVR
jgi:hypothetical protein